jgi:hypothetical protein
VEVYYWSSKEYDANNAWAIRFNNGYQFYLVKSNAIGALSYVRPVRAF